MVSWEVGDSSNFFDISQLCNEPLWSLSQTWNSSTPDFGICIERTVLVWAPCFFLWICCPFYIIVLKRRPVYPIPWTALTYTKVMVSVLLLLVAVTEIVWAVVKGPSVVPTADFLAPAVLLITQILHLMLVILGVRHSERSSGLLWLFWCCVLLCGLPQLYTTITSTVHQVQRLPATLVVTFLLQYLSCLVLFITNCISDAPSKLQSLYKTEKSSPELDASFVSRLFFWWNGPLVWRGWRRPLTSNDMWDVVPHHTALYVYESWQATLTRGGSSKCCKMRQNNRLTIASTLQAGRVSLFSRLWIMTRWSLLSACMFYFISEGFRFLSPQLLSLLISFMTENTEPMWHGYIYAVSLFLVCECTTLMRNAYFNGVITLSIRIRSALMAAVYNKALHLSGSARRESTLGQIVNLMAVDAQAVGDTMFHLSNLMFAPLVILVALAFLWERLGYSVLAGVAVLLLIIPINSVILKKSKEIQFNTMTFKDSRVKMINEIISGIKVLKFYAWESAFTSRIEAVREEELKLYQQYAILQALSSFIFNVAPYLVALATFTTFLLVSPQNVLDAETAFVSIALFNIIRMPVLQMPNVISQLIQASVALKRMEKYISASELDPSAVSSDPSEHGAVVVHGGQFSWWEGDEGDERQDSWHLQDIELEVPHGQLVAVVGAVGSGKSSLLSALLGEMRKDAGKAVVNGNLAYVSQQAWLQNATLRDNITWGQPFERRRYQNVLRACALQTDLDMLPAGDSTEIGEKGINISGGQKQRVALARAVYSQASVVLLDDPLSAVDSHVGRHIFDNVIGPHGILQGKTRVLVTHAITFLPQVDQIMVMKNGRLVESGSYDNLLASGGDFAQFIVQHINEMDEDEEGELKELCDHLEEVAGGDVLLRQLSVKSSTISGTTRERHVSGRYRSVSETDDGRHRSGSSRETPNDSWPALFEDHSSLNSPSDTINRRHSPITTPQDYSNFHNYATSSINRSISIDDSEFTNHVNTDVKLSMDRKSSEIKGQKLIEEEVSETGKIARHVYLVYGRAMGILFVIIPIVFMSLGQVNIAGSNVWLSYWSSSGHSNSSSDIEVSRDVFLAVYGAFGLGQAFFLLVGIVLVMVGGVRASRVLHHNLFYTIIRLPMSFFDTNPSGRIMNRFSKDINVLDVILPNTSRAFINIFSQVVTTMIVIVMATPIMAAFILPIMCLYYFIQQVFVATSRQLMRIESVSKSPIYSHFSETIQGVSTIRAYKKQSSFFKESLRRIENSLKASYINISVNRWLGVHLETLGNVITLAVAILGVAGRETISPGIVGLSVTYALNVTAILNWLVRIVSDLEANIVSVERINEYIKIEREAAWRVEKEKAPPARWPETGSVSFSNYETRYRPGLDLVLRGITCSIRPSEKVGIVGRTGAGKSSLMLALFRLIEASRGSIDIDNINIAKIGLHDLRSQISIIPQDPVLFSGTLRLNLDPFGIYEDADIWRALELAHLGNYIQNQPKGLDHIVDEDGSNFSVGQRQLVCLARALLRNSPILVLDEATAAVDLETDQFIQATIRNQFAACTVLTVAHRLNTIIDYDRVMVLQEGRVAEFDSPSTLLERPHSIFYGMAKEARLV